ncbi:Nn.00g070240.m01.CDS01 [Neocucurbitaria sp. VM-36]
MEPLTALGAASNVIQLVDFSTRLLSRGHKLYNSADGRIEEHAVLDNAAQNLSELCSDLSNSIVTYKHGSTADKQLIALQEESVAVTQRLREALAAARLKPGHRKWQSIYQAVRSVYSDQEISKLATQLDNIRKQIDTVLLVHLRQALNKPSSVQSTSVEADQRHAELLNAIREHNWQATRTDHVEDFSKQLRSHAAMDHETRFRKLILARLYFPRMPDRFETIPNAYSNTFRWIFDDQEESANEPTPWDSFTNWLQQDDSSIYWITGKPGSGKSTLMKYIYDHGSLPTLLSAWAVQKDLAKAGFYFWNSGSVNQMSRLGCFQTLLYTCFEQHGDLILTAFPERWEQFIAFGGGHDPLDWTDIRRAFKHLISVRSKKFFFLIDGLDEFEGEPKEIIELILNATQSNVKMCVASRPWLAFQDAFKNKPSLLLERLTRQDILKYVEGNFRENEHYIQLKLIEPAAASALPTDIVNKASGVFLWVYLVVQSLLEGLSNSDHISDLQVRLDALPSDLEALFDKLLSRLEPQYFRQACETFRLIRTYRDFIANETPTLLGLYYADDRNMTSSLEAPRTTSEPSLALQRSAAMRRRLTARCRGFLEIMESSIHSNYNDTYTSYFHRTARDFVESAYYWPLVLETTGHNSFQPEQRWANAFLWMLKSHPLETTRARNSEMCLVFASYLQKKSGFIQKTYLDEFCRTRFDNADKPQYGLLELQVEMCRLAPGMSEYLILILKMASPGERLRVLFRMLKESYRDKDQSPEIRSIMKYYSSPKFLRWRYHRPRLPPYV